MAMYPFRNYTELFINPGHRKINYAILRRLIFRPDWWSWTRVEARADFSIKRNLLRMMLCEGAGESTPHQFVVLVRYFRPMWFGLSTMRFSVVWFHEHPPKAIFGIPTVRQTFHVLCRLDQRFPSCIPLIKTIGSVLVDKLLLGASYRQFTNQTHHVVVVGVPY